MEVSRLLAPLEAKGDALLSRFLQDRNGSVKCTPLLVPGRRTIFARRIVESSSAAERVFFEQMKPKDEISQRVTIFYESLRRESAHPDFVPALHYQATMNNCRYFLFDHIDVSSTLALELLRSRHGIDRELGRSAVECLVRISSGFEDLFQRANIAHRAFHKIYSARVEPYLERQFRINGADPEYTALLERTLAVWPSIEARFQKVRLVPCHGDSHAENFIVSREGAVSVIDWEHYGWAPMGADLVWVFADRLGCPEFEACLDQYFDGVSPGMSGDERRYLVAILAIFAAMNKGQHLSIKWLRYLNA